MAEPHDRRSTSLLASPAEALSAPPEQLVYLACLHVGTGVDAPDFLAVVDAEPGSDRYGQVVHETPMPNVGDELHHYGWNRCSSACHGPDRTHLIVPGFRSSRIHILNIAEDPRRPTIEKVLEPEEVVRETGYTRPTHRALHARGEGRDQHARRPRRRAGRRLRGAQRQDLRARGALGERRRAAPFSYDFWYQPRKNVLVSSEFGEPNAYEKGFDPEDVAAGRYGRRLHFWDLAERRLKQTIDLADHGLIPLEVRWLHDPEAEEGFVGAALSSAMWHFHRSNGAYEAAPTIQVENEELEGWPLPGGVPGLITDLVLSMDDRMLYFSNWLHGDLRQYDVSDPQDPKLVGRLWLGACSARRMTRAASSMAARRCSSSHSTAVACT